MLAIHLTIDEHSTFSSGFVTDSIKELFIVCEKELKNETN